MTHSQYNQTTYLTTNPSSIPLGWGTDSETLGPIIMEPLVKQTLRNYDHRFLNLSLTEASAVALLRKLDAEAFDAIEMESFSYFLHLPYHKFSSKINRCNWHSIVTLYKTWLSPVSVHDCWVKADSGEKFFLPDLEKYTTPYSLHTNTHHMVKQTPAAFPSWNAVSEIGRCIRFTNGCVVRHHASLDRITVVIDASFLLLLAGDVETNPGPVVRDPVKARKDQIERQQIQMKAMQREIMRLKREQEKQSNHVQRQLELEKRDRKRKRKAASTTRHAQGLRSFTENLGVSAEVLAQGLGPTMEMAQKALQSMLEAGDQLKSIFKIPAEYDIIGILISLISIGDALTQKQLLTVTLHSVQLARLLGISLSKLMSLIPSEETIIAGEIVQGIFYRADAVDNVDLEPVQVAQSLVTDMMKTATQHPELLPFSGFLAFVCGVFNLLCSGVFPSPSDMSRHFANVGRAAQGFRAIKELFNFLSDYFVEIYYTTVYGLTKEEFDFMQNYPQIENIYAASKIVEELDRSTIDSSAQIANQILSMNHQLNDYLYQANKMNSRSNQSLIQNLQKRMKSQIDWATHSPARCHTIRETPVALYLYGHPGVGKSVLTDVIKARIFKNYLSKRGIKYETCSYPRRARNEFWEGYTNQPIVILDDFGNVKDSMMKPVEEYEELENMVNTVQYPLKMAELKSKGCTNFTSEFIIASSNQLYPEIKHLTDPGAVYRRFHVWADVKIDPAYGVAIGKDEMGKSYYSYDKETVAKLKNIDADKLNPLMTEHYRLSLYKVMYNEQTKCAEVVSLTGLQDISFEQYWEYVMKKNDAQKHEGKKLSDAIRLEAGIETPGPPTTEKDIMMKFDKIFSPEKFLSAVAESDFEDDMFGNLFSDATSDEIFGDLSSFVHVKDRLYALTEHFNKFKSDCHNKIVEFCSKLKQLAGTISNKFLAVAQFILSFFQISSGRCYEYLPSVPSASIIAGTSTILVAVLGVWYSGIFNRKPSNDNNSWCQFINAPSNATMPCCECEQCKILEFPPSGCMLSHFLERTGVKSVRKDMCSLGYSPTVLEETREAVRVRTNAQRVYETQPNVASQRPFAQRIYETQPKVATHQPHAQKVYEQQPTTVPFNRFAQGTIECKTEMHIGARKYAQRDRVQIEQTTQTLLSNSVWIQAVDDKGLACRSNGVFLVGRTMITTAHTLLNPPHIDPITKIIIRNPYSTHAAIEIPFDQCKISQVHQMDGTPVDLALVSFPPVVPNRPRILSKFLDAKHIDALMEGQMTFSGFYEVNGKTIVQEKYPNKFAVTSKNTEYYLHSPGTCPKNAKHCVCPIKIGNHIDYDLETHNGMCGALLSINNNMIHTKLIGFHVAGGSGVLALGALTTRQLLEAALAAHVKKFNIPESYLIDGRLPYSQSWVDPSQQASLLEVGDCISVGSAKAPSAPVQTQLRPSLVFDKIQQHITKPAHLKPVVIDDEKVNPMERGIKKILGSQTWVDPDLLEAAANDVFQGLGLPPSGKGIVHSYEEAITGVEGDSYKRPINRTTSPGYPYNMDNKQKGKTAWLGDGEEYITDNPELKHDVSNLISLAQQGIRGDAISLATLKDEKRPLAKVDAGKTRVFEACPQHLVIAIRQYFLDFTAHVMRHRIDNGIAVGINPYSLEWTKLAHHLLQQGNHMVAGDFSNFDGSLLMQILVKICDKINEWYNDEHSLTRSALWEHLCNADVLVNGDVIRQTHSQPSGNPLTVIINSLFNAIVMRIAYMQLKREQGKSALCDYRKYVSEIVYGDDDIKSIHVEILDWFNQVTITKALATLGLTYTDETKSGKIHPWKRLEDTAFLKRRFICQPDGTYLAPMDLENVLEITNWVRGKAVRAATLENCSQTLMELALHQKPLYDYWSSRVREECSKVGLNIFTPTWYEQMEEYRYNRDLYDRSEYTPLW